MFVHFTVPIYSQSGSQEFAKLQMQLFRAGKNKQHSLVKVAINLFSTASWKKIAPLYQLQIALQINV